MRPLPSTSCLCTEHTALPRWRLEPRNWDYLPNQSLRPAAAAATPVHSAGGREVLPEPVGWGVGVGWEMLLQPLPTRRPHPQPEGRQSSGACSSGNQRSDAGLVLGVSSAFSGLGDLGQALRYFCKRRSRILTSRDYCRTEQDPSETRCLYIEVLPWYCVSGPHSTESPPIGLHQVRLCVGQE